MAKYFEVQISFGKNKWTTVEKTNLHKDALDYVAKAGAVKYAFRVVRIVKTVVFEGK